MKAAGSTFLLFFATVLVGMHVFAAPACAADKYEWQAGKWVKAAKPEEGSAEGELAIVQDHLEAGRYGKVVKAAKRFAKRYPLDAQYEEVCMLAGKAEIARKRYWQAYQWFEKQLDQFPAGGYSDQALRLEYEVAEAFLGGQKRVTLGFMKLKATDEALEILMRISEHAPGTELAAKSLLRIADHHYLDRKYVEAVDAYDTFLKVFPRSNKSGYAAGQAAKAAWECFEGTRFDETPLLEAEQRFSSFIASYPSEARKIGARRTLQQIQATRAQKLFETARFYERIGKPSSAVFYYRQIIASYPGTQWAKDASLDVAVFDQVNADKSLSPPEKPRKSGAIKPARPDMAERTEPANNNMNVVSPVKGGNTK